VDVGVEEIEKLRQHERTGRPMGADGYVMEMENLLDRRLRPQKPGPKPKDK
jgi:putative transposase